MTPVIISGAVEGLIDEAVLRRLISHVGAAPGSIYGKNGKDDLLRKLGGYNNAAQFRPWVVLVDLNQEADCAPPFCKTHLPDPASHMCFRVAVRQVEAWLLADRDRIAAFLSVSPAQVPRDPETEEDPKRAMVNLARQSSQRAIREDMVPRPGSGRDVGPAYASRLVEFARDPWRPDVAAGSSNSLNRCLRCLRRLAAQTANNTA